MIHYLQHDEINRTKWDALISSYGMVYALSWYLDVVHPGWEALVLDDYEAVMPLTGGKKFGVDYLFQPYFAQQLGVFSRQPLSPDQIKLFLDAIPKSFRFAEIRMNEGNACAEGMEGMQPHRNIVLDLNRDYDTIREAYHTNTKRNLAKAESNGLQIVNSVIPYHVVALFRDNRGATLTKWKDAEYARLTWLGQVAISHNAAFVVGVTQQGVGELLSAALFMKTHERVIFLFSGCSEQGKELHAMSFLLDEMIRKHAAQALTFDFEGSDDDNLARFYLGFGGEQRTYPSYSFNRLSALGNTMLKVWKKRK